MIEKLSDRHIREDKIKRLKDKAFAEIANELNLIKRDIKEHVSNDKAFDFLVKQSFALLNLKEYLESEYAFQSCEAVYSDKGVVIYTVSSKDLDIWLQDDYSLVHNFLHKAEDCQYDVFPLLNDYYFGYNFTGVFDTILYDKKTEEQETLEGEFVAEAYSLERANASALEDVISSATQRSNEQTSTGEIHEVNYFKE